MAVNLVSPGVKIREVDLTTGRIDQANDQIGAFAGPFAKGPVELPVLIQTEQQLLEVFGKPKTENSQNVYWLHASNYLSYGGILQVVRADSTAEGAMNNAYVGVGTTSEVKIKSVEDYVNKTQGDTISTPLPDFYYAAKNPGTWANDLTIYTIDGAADQIISGISTTVVETTEFVSEISTLGSVVGGASSITGISTAGISLGQLVVCAEDGIVPSGAVVVGINSAIGIGTDFTDTVYLSDAVSNTIISLTSTFDFGATGITTSGISLDVGYGVKITKSDVVYSGVGTTETFNGYLKGIITGIGNSTIDVKLISSYSEATESHQYIDYSGDNPLYSIQEDIDTIEIIDPTGPVAIATYTSYNVKDWYNNQTVTLGNNTIYWKNIADRPATSEYTKSNGGKNDEFNVIVVDNLGKVNGNVGEILERFIKLSKAKDGKISPAQQTYYKDYLRDNSTYLFAGSASEGVSSKFSTINGYGSYSGGTWGDTASNSFFTVVGNKEFTLGGGTDYSASSQDYGVSLGDITNAYSLFENPAQYGVNFIINGPSGGDSIFEAQAKANYIISLAESRKDCIAVVSAYDKDVIGTSNSNTQTDNILKFFNGVSASTYAVFDSGYKYTYDRFNNRFLYLACNSDIAGLMAKTSINQYAWVSPAGATRGVLNNAVKLAYNPSEAQRDLLYTNRINPVIVAQGQGIILYGDKTASAYVSAFDRINVRRLFLTIEKAIERSARSQLFEFNDAITRSNFVNIVEPYLRDVRAKRGITEFLVVCDESNNTPDIIDSNQFKADIYVKPARSINFIGLTFVATRTGVSFSEIVGTV